MAKTGTKAATTLAVFGVGFVASAAGIPSARAGEPIGKTVVLHLDSQVDIPLPILRAAQQEAVRVYQQIGVRLEWTDGHARSAASDSAEHLDVIVVTPEHADARSPDRAVLGRASRETRRAYIFYERVVAHAANTGSGTARALAFVFAHEVGHMLLPANSHSVSGLMRGHWEGPIDAIPPFHPAQAAAIRDVLGRAN